MPRALSQVDNLPNYAALQSDAANGDAMAQFILEHTYELDAPCSNRWVSNVIVVAEYGARP